MRRKTKLQASTGLGCLEGRSQNDRLAERQTGMGNDTDKAPTCSREIDLYLLIVWKTCYQV